MKSLINVSRQSYIVYWVAMVISTVRQTIIMFHVIEMRLRKQVNALVINFGGCFALRFPTGQVRPQVDECLEKRAS